MAENKNGLGNRPYHKGASYSRFVFIRETKGSDWFTLFVANLELGKASLGYVQFNWCKSVFHFTDLSLAHSVAAKLPKSRQRIPMVLE